MSALTVLYVVLPFPILYLLHDMEEIIMANRWLERHREKLLTQFPQFRVIIRHLLKLDTLAFTIAAAEEIIILLLAAAAILVDIPYSVLIWSGLFMAFALHLVLHLIELFLIRNYVPGTVTAILSIPYVIYSGNMIVHAFPCMHLLFATLCGVAFMFGNLLLAQHLGIKISNLLHRR